MDSNHGSVWRKWDFHVHTPYSILNNNFGFDPFELSGTTLESKFDEYVIKLFTAAVQQEIAAIGITDYFMIEGYKRIKQNYLDCPEKMRQCFPDEALRHAVEQIYVFPNIELRLNNFIGKDAHSVNYHVCFSSDISIQEIEDNFLHRLDFKFDNAPYPLTISNLKLLGNHIKSDNEISGSDIFVGLNHVTVSYTDVLEKLQNNPAFTGKYLIVIPVDEDLPKVSWKGRNYSTRRDLYKQCNCFFTSNRRTIDWALAAGEENSRIHEFGSIKPCIWGSDAHGYDRLFKPDNDNFCWIKADPSFEGLTQILYEPAERVRIQSNCPDVRDVHQLIDSVQFNDSNFKASISSLLGEKYGWGGFEGLRDCSLMTKNLLFAYGIWLPRNSKLQGNIGEIYSFYGMDNLQKTAQIKAFGKPFRTLLYMNGHIMLYAGIVDENIAILHDIWGLKTIDDGREIIGQIALTTPFIGKDSNLIPNRNLLISRIKSMNIVR